MIKYILTTGSLFLFAFYCLGQQGQDPKKMKAMMDSIKHKYMEEAALKNPTLRQAGVLFEGFGSSTIKSKLHGDRFFEGKVRSSRLSAYFNVPIAHFGKNLVSTTFGARQQQIELSDVKSYLAGAPEGEMDLTKTVASGSLSITRIDSLFNRPVVYSVTATGLIDPESGQYRLAYTGIFLITLKHTATSSLSLGLLGLLDPTAPFPVIPFIRYSKRWNEHRLDLTFDPSRVSLRKELAPKHFLWLSNDIGGNVAMFKIDHDGMPPKSIYSTLELKSGLTYEHRVTNTVVLTVGAGVSSTLTSKMLEHNKNKDPFIENKQGMAPYIQVGISCLPFWKGLSR